MRNGYLMLGFLLIVHGVHAETNTIIQTRQSLKTLESKISQLQHTLSTVHDKRAILNREMASTEKQIRENLQKLQQIQKNIALKDAEIKQLEQQIFMLDQTLSNQQQQLANQVRARYKTGEYQPLKWLLTKDKPQTINRLLTYYQYVLRKNQQIIALIRKNQMTLAIKKEKLNQTIHELKHLQGQWSTKQQQLTDNNRYHTSLIHSLNSEIETKQQTLSSYKRNQLNLSRLLITLTRQSVLQTRHPITQMRKNLALPVLVMKNNIKKINQGIMFYAPEGTRVSAVFPGKVVFSDWLNGYGNLLIIDHGWGFMTLYANNHALFSKKGDTVNQGEKIATTGHSGIIRQDGLYFEIRHHGKVIPPLDWLKM